MLGSAVRLRLAPFLTAGALLGCGAPPDEVGRPTPIPSPGRVAYLAEACPTCHGRDRLGTNTGPPIVRARERWDKQQLTRFLRAPAAFKQADPRLRQLSERYRSDMPALFSPDDGRVRALVVYLLEE